MAASVIKEESHCDMSSRPHRAHSPLGIGTRTPRADWHRCAGTRGPPHHRCPPLTQVNSKGLHLMTTKQPLISNATVCLANYLGSIRIFAKPILCYYWFLALSTF